MFIFLWTYYMASSISCVLLFFKALLLVEYGILFISYDCLQKTWVINVSLKNIEPGNQQPWFLYE